MMSNYTIRCQANYFHIALNMYKYVSTIITFLHFIPTLNLFNNSKMVQDHYGDK